jgi:hypothetical protein
VNDVSQRICPGCRVSLDRRPWALDRDLRASPECWHANGLVSMFETEHPPLAVLHQLTTDTYGAQHPGPPTPVIRVAYALVGLYLALRCGIDGITVRGAHQRMGKPQPWWPVFEPPADPGPVTVLDVLRAGAQAGSVDGHTAQVRLWAASVWQSWSARHGDVKALTERLFAGEFVPR